MEITYLKLVNFKNILSAMNRRMLEIDFSKARHRIIIFLGENGSGKSSILRELHPFPNSGSTDNRNIKELILEDTEGYKELHIQDGNDLYKIRHHYTKSGSVKSYINKNGDELNGNGNVTSFLECLYDEFGLSKDFLNLLRLGANDSNFIKMSATERKKFTTSLLDDVHIYNKLFKQMSDRLRLAKATLKSVVEKLNRLKVYSLEDLDDEINQVEKVLSINLSANTKLIEERAVLDAERTTALRGGSFEEVQDELKQKKKRFDTIQASLAKMDTSVSADSMVELVRQADDALQENERETERVNSEIAEKNNLLADYQNSIDKFTYQLGNYNEHEEERLQQLIDSYHEKIDTTYKKYKDLMLPYSIEDMKEALELMRSIDNVSNLMIGFATKAKHELVELYLEEPTKNHETHIGLKLVTLERKLEKAKASKTSLIHQNKVEKADTRFMFKPAGCQYSNCSMEAFYKSITEQKEFDTAEIDRTIAKLEKEIDTIDDYYAINSNIQYIRMILDSNARLIDKVPRELFEFRKILTSIMTEQPFYNEEEITSLINIAEGHSMYTEYMNKIETCTKELEMYKENSKATKLIREELDKANQNKQSVLARLTSLRERLKGLEQEKEHHEVTIHQLRDTLEVVQNMESLVAEQEGLTEDLRQISTNMMTFVNHSKRIAEIDKEANELSYHARVNQDKLETLRRNKLLYLELLEERKQLEEEFEEVTDIRKSLSSTEGIPLLYMKVYMMDSLNHINDLLNIVYGGSLEVQTFQIDEDVFRIPYVRNGISVPDVRSCSQGEETFLSMAISFAFIARSIERYNILLFDEIDAALDQRRRAEFLKILNTELDEIGATQAFFITHNNAFYDYPVDAIITSPISIDNYKNINVIFNATA